MSYLDNIKAIATELASMSPRTQIELVKLCKELCIQTKNYLVAFDETTLPALDARIEALETLTNNLSSELNIAEGNITANANAISTIQDTITTIQTALSNVYTKTQIDTMLASYYTKSDINTMFGSYYTKGEVNTLLSAKANANDVYTKTEVDTALSGKASLSGDNTFMGVQTFSNGTKDVSVFDLGSIYFRDLDEDLDDLFTKKQDKLYMHKIEIYAEDANTSGIYLQLEIINTRSTQMNYNDLRTKYNNMHLPLHAYDTDGMTNLGSVIPSHIVQMNANSIEIAYYIFNLANNQFGLTSDNFNVIEITDTVITL